MKTTLDRPTAATAVTRQKPAAPLLEEHRKWEVVIQGGDLKRKLHTADLKTDLRAVRKILDRCPKGAKLTVIAYEVKAVAVSFERAKAYLNEKGVVLCCSCEMVSWAIQHAADVDQDTTSWMTETVQTGKSGKPAIMLLSNRTVHTVETPENLRRGTMLLVVSQEEAEKHRKPV